MKSLTRMQSNIIEFIKRHVKENGYPPTIREIGDAVGLASSSTVHGHLNRLEKRGFLRRDPERPRAIEVIDDQGRRSVAAIEIPIFSSLKDKTVSGYFSAPSYSVGQNKDVFMIAVKDDQMIEDGIHNGDLVIVSRRSVKNGDIVLANGENEHVVRNLTVIRGKYILRAGKTFGYATVAPKEAIIGKVIGVYRNIGEVS